MLVVVSRRYCDIHIQCELKWNEISLTFYNEMISFEYAFLIVILLILKAYAVTALMKIYSFEIAAGRKVDMLPEVGSLNYIWVCFGMPI